MGRKEQSEKRQYKRLGKGKLRTLVRQVEV